MTPQYLGLFAIGMLAAGVAFSKDLSLAALRSRLPWGLMTAIALTGLVIASRLLPSDNYSRPLLDLLVGLFAACLLVAASREGHLQGALSCRPLAVVGGFGYSLYLIHFPILQLVWQYFIQPLGRGAGTSLALHWLIGLPLAVLGAFLFHLAFERPFMSSPPPKTERQAEAAAIVSPAP